MSASKEQQKDSKVLLKTEPVKDIIISSRARDALAAWMTTTDEEIAAATKELTAEKSPVRGSFTLYVPPPRGLIQIIAGHRDVPFFWIVDKTDGRMVYCQLVAEWSVAEMMEANPLIILMGDEVQITVDAKEKHKPDATP